MRTRTIRIAALVTVLFLSALVPAHAARAGAERPVPKGRARDADPITPALDKRIRGLASPDDVRVELLWDHDTHEIYGDGVGIWARTAEYRLSKAEVFAILKALAKARFGSMEPRMGEEEREQIGMEEGSPVRGALTVAIGPVTKTVMQYRGGEQSPPLLALATEIAKVSATAAKKGQHIASLTEGLQKMAAGQLSREALDVLVQRKIDHPADADETEGWLLQLRGRWATARALSKARPSGSARQYALAPNEMEALVAFLGENDPVKMPQSVYAPQYTDFRIRILNKNRYVSARRFAGMKPDAHGAEQEKFNRIYDRFHQLYAQVQKSGQPLVEVAPPRAERERESEREKKKEKEAGREKEEKKRD